MTFLSMVGLLAMIIAAVFFLLWALTVQDGFCSPAGWFFFMLLTWGTEHPIIFLTTLIGIGILVGKFIL